MAQYHGKFHFKGTELRQMVGKCKVPSHHNLLTAFDAQRCYSNALNFKILTAALGIRDQLARYVKKLNIHIESSQLATSQVMRKCLAMAYADQDAVQLPNGSFKTTKGGLVRPDLVG